MGKEKHWLNMNDGTAFKVHTYSDGDIKIEHIARSLAFTTRFRGHIKRFYSVAEHSILCARYVNLDHAKKLQDLKVIGNYSEFVKLSLAMNKLSLFALLHDSEEFIIGDIPGPIKKLYGNKILNMGKRLRFRILRWAGLGLEDIHHFMPIVHDIDMEVFCKEAQIVFDKINETWEAPAPDSVASTLEIKFYQPNQTLINKFIRTFNNIRKEINKWEKKK